jgi:hypothetical protein
VKSGAGEAAAGVRHHVALSIVGIDRTRDNGYFRAKVAQEKLIETSGIPYTIARMLRDRWLAWPARVGPLLAAQFEVDAGAVTVALEAFVRDALGRSADPKPMARAGCRRTTARSKKPRRLLVCRQGLVHARCFQPIPRRPGCGRRRCGGPPRNVNKRFRMR